MKTAGASREELLAVHLDAQQFFRGHLDTTWAVAYLARRGFTQVITDEWGIGFAPAGGNLLINHLYRKGYSADTMIRAGVALPARGGRLLDRFRNRITIPIRNEAGELIAFLGRAEDGSDDPRYLNSPTNELYEKSGVLFGLDRAGRRSISGAQPVLVEGAFDAIAVSTTPNFFGVAPCGANLTDQQVRLLARATPVKDLGIVTAFDSDNAGHKASLAAYDKLTLITDYVYRAALPPGCDPADILEEGGPDLLSGHLSLPSSLSDLVVDAELDAFGPRADGYRPLDHAEGIYAALRRSTAVLVGKPSRDVHRQVKRIAARLNEPTTDVMAAFIASASALDDHPPPAQAAQTARTLQSSPPPRSPGPALTRSFGL